jgi:hypothetical protein
VDRGTSARPEPLLTAPDVAEDAVRNPEKLSRVDRETCLHR